MKRKRIHILLATALLMAATITGCDQNKSGKQPAEPTKVENEQQTEVTMEVMEALAKVMPKYNEVYSFSEGLAAVSDSETHLYGFIDKMLQLATAKPIFMVSLTRWATRSSLANTTTFTKVSRTALQWFPNQAMTGPLSTRNAKR